MTNEDIINDYLQGDSKINITLKIQKTENLTFSEALKKVEDAFDYEFSRKCKICGCSWLNGCTSGCYWIATDLCSECTDK